jgi:hypothetical protein
VELIVLNVGLSLGVISTAMFSVLVVMALVTTCSTGPLLSLLEARSRVRGFRDTVHPVQVSDS